jgi:hypothetical protein
MDDCEAELLGPLGSVVGHCDRHHGHEGPCSVNGVTEQMMLDRLNSAVTPSPAPSEESGR